MSDIADQSWTSVQFELLGLRANEIGKLAHWDIRSRTLQNGLRAIVAGAACTRDTSISANFLNEALFIILNGLNLYGRSPFDLNAKTGLQSLIASTATALSRELGKPRALELIEGIRGRRSPSFTSYTPNIFNGGRALLQHMVSVAELIVSQGAEASLQRLVRNCGAHDSVIESIYRSIKNDDYRVLSRFSDSVMLEMCLPRRQDAYRAAARELVVCKYFSFTEDPDDSELNRDFDLISLSRWFSTIEGSEISTLFSSEMAWKIMAAKDLVGLLTVLNAFGND